MTTVAAIGECMVELTHSDDELLRLGYAGDTFNTAVYLVRSAPADVRVEYVTYVGDDWYSERALARMSAERVGTAYVRKVAGRSLGLYLVRTDEAGERSFTYHRDRAPARELFGPDHPVEIDRALASCDLVHLSAITLQILTPQARERLWRTLSEVRATGGRVSFDSNYRPSGWGSAAEARAAVEQALEHTDIALPSSTDEHALFGDADAQACVDRLRGHGVPEVVLKDGPAGCLVSTGDRTTHVPALRVPTVVDTTAAGDSFNGAYLAARLGGADPVAAAHEGHRLAASVIQQVGAFGHR